MPAASRTAKHGGNARGNLGKGLVRQSRLPGHADGQFGHVGRRDDHALAGDGDRPQALFREGRKSGRGTSRMEMMRIMDCLRRFGLPVPARPGLQEPVCHEDTIGRNSPEEPSTLW